MELWKNFETSEYYLINRDEGSQQVCNKYGETPVSFKAYSTGFQNFRSAYTCMPDSNYRVQPKNFDGYFQCPRPLSSTSGLKRPYTRDNKRYATKRLASDISKLPKPVPSLGFSRIYDKSIKSKSTRIESPIVQNIGETFQSIESMKKNQEEKPEINIKTANEIFKSYKNEIKNIKGFIPIIEKPQRRKLKGFYLVNFPTSSDLFMKEKKHWLVLSFTGLLTVSLLLAMRRFRE